MVGCYPLRNNIHDAIATHINPYNLWWVCSQFAWTWEPCPLSNHRHSTIELAQTNLLLAEKLTYLVLSVSKVLIAPIFPNNRNCETERDPSDMLRIKSPHLQEICQFDLSFFVVSLSLPKLRRFEIDGAIITLETASTNYASKNKTCFWPSRSAHPSPDISAWFLVDQIERSCWLLDN